jgi:hypothetical protein
MTTHDVVTVSAPSNALHASTAPSSLCLPPTLSPLLLSAVPIPGESAVSPCSVQLLAAAAARVEARPVTYGPLWSVCCSTHARPRIELQVYDVFCMVFLDRPGAYYRVDQVARTSRGRITAELIITQLRTYHRLFHGAQREHKEEVYLTNMEIKQWWMMPRQVRASLDHRLALEPAVPAYDYGYVPFLRRFIPQNRDKDREYRFFSSLTRYLPLLLSAVVQLCRSPAMSSSTFTYGVFASRALRCGEYSQPLQPLLGEVVPITDEEQNALTRAGADFSVLVLDVGEVSRMSVPGRNERKRQRVSQGVRAFIVVGGMAFLNHACRPHANIWPAVWPDQLQDVGSAQWQLATAKQDVSAGDELFLCYANYDADTEEDETNEWPCTVCVQSMRSVAEVL